MGREHKGKGVHVALGPMMNMGYVSSSFCPSPSPHPLLHDLPSYSSPHFDSRIAQGGRNWEGFGADPFLSGEGAYETILGMQAGGVQACAKHYINK